MDVEGDIDLDDAVAGTREKIKLVEIDVDEFILQGVDKTDVCEMASATRPTATDACAWAKALRCGSPGAKAP